VFQRPAGSVELIEKLSLKIVTTSTSKGIIRVDATKVTSLA
jgi:hypothetical protein